MPQLTGGNGRIRTYTLRRMKALHDHYATLPYRNTLGIHFYSYRVMSSIPVQSGPTLNVFAYGRTVETCTPLYGLKARCFAI
jgi:hypothetical protein